MADQETKPERKFQVGDIVKVLTPKDQDEYSGWDWGAKDEKLEGKCFTINRVAHPDDKWPYRLDLGNKANVSNRWEPEACLVLAKKWEVKKYLKEKQNVRDKGTEV